MLVRHLRVVRFLGFVALAVPVTVIACASETVEVRNEDPAPPASATGSSQPMPPTQPTTTTKPPDDGGTGAGKDSGPPPTDVADSAECQAYCAKMKTTCNRTCDPKVDCKIESGQCAASTRDYVDCKTTKGSWSCGSSGFTIISSCKRNASLCD